MKKKSLALALLMCVLLILSACGSKASSEAYRDTMIPNAPTAEAPALDYDKAESLFLQEQNLRDIFTLSGIVRPALLVDGTVAGYWNLKNRNLTVTLLGDVDRDLIHTAAQNLWPDLKAITFK